MDSIARVIPRFLVGSAFLLLLGTPAVAQQSEPDSSGFGTYTPLRGFRIAETDKGDLNVKLYTYIRYINQQGLDESYTDSFGTVKSVDPRQDIQFQKVNIQFLGWILDPRLRYLAYVWTSNTSQGLGAQVVVGGNLSFRFSDRLTLSGGIGALPGTRNLEGNFPLWNSVDNRPIAEEFFRPSYTSGLWASGDVVPGLHYQVMVGNNMSQLGVDAGQLDDKLDTWSASLAWYPTTGEYGAMRSQGDFDQHDQIATRVAGHFTRSSENAQSQPGTEGFENVQIRLSDGNTIFQPDLFGPGIRITDADYRMVALDAGVKYRGFALEGGWFWRSVDNFEGPGTGALEDLDDTGFMLLGSAMLIPRTVQVYATTSKIFGEYGDPSEFRLGGNWYPFQSQVVRLNAEYLHLNQSPVGALSLPYVVGGNGGVFYTSFELNF